MLEFEISLSMRELEIVDALVVGASSRDIAHDLHLSYHTVRTHIRNIYAKTGVVNRVELVHWRERSASATPD